MVGQVKRDRRKACRRGAKSRGLHLLDRNKPFAEIEFPDLDEQVRTRLGEDGPRITLQNPAPGTVRSRRDGV